MKKENIILVKFIGLMLSAVAVGILAGRLSLPLARGEIFLPQAIATGPVLLAVAAFCLVSGIRHTDSAAIQQSVILAATGFGVVLSGCCGFYTLKDVPFVVVTAVVFMAVFIAAIYGQSAADHKIHSRQIYHSTAEKMVAAVFFAVMGVSLFAPIGPMPALATGTVWLTVTKKSV